MKDYARRRKLDNTAEENTQHGGDPMDVGAIHQYWEHGHEWNEEDIDAAG